MIDLESGRVGEWAEWEMVGWMELESIEFLGRADGIVMGSAAVGEALVVVDEGLVDEACAAGCRIVA